MSARPGESRGLPRGRALLLDALLVGAFVALLVDRLFLGLGTVTDVAGGTWWTFPLFLCGDLALLWRRTRPELAVLAVYAASGLHALLTDAGAEGAFVLFPALVGLYSLGAYAPWRRLAAGVLGVAALSIVHDTRDPGIHLDDETEVWSWLLWTSVLVLALVAGLLVGSLRRASAQRQAALAADRMRAEAVAVERAKIARELHDVVTHNVNVVVMQAMAASGLLDSDPERVRAPLAAIEDSGREALAEMRRMLGVLREEDDLLLSPQPGIADIPRLVHSVRQAGQDVTCDLADDLGALPADMGLVLFRVAQESLTNAITHARGAAAHLTVRRTPTEVELEVSNGPGQPTEGAAGAGQGLVGMAERVALFGGRLRAGPAPGGGFRVLATLPLEPM